MGSTGAHTDDADAQGVEGPRSGAAAPCRMNDSVSSLGEDPELVVSNRFGLYSVAIPKASNY